MWKIGDIEIEGRVVLAPMAGVTSSGYREFNHPFGVAVSVSEMVSDMGLIYDNKQTNQYVLFNKLFPTGLQLFGSSPETMAKAAKIAQNANKNIDFFDINMGCPVPKVTNSGAGSALMKNPQLCGEIIRAVKEATGLPVTAKIRLGWDNRTINYLEVIEELEKAGVAAIAIHARTKKELYTGEPHFDLLKDLRNKMNVPLIVSGNIFALDDAIKAVELTKADAVMVARGAMGNPFLIKQIDTYFRSGERLENPSLKEQISWCLELADYLIKEKGEILAMRIYRSIAPRFFMGFPNCKKYRTRLVTELVDRDSLVKILHGIEEENVKQINIVYDR